MMIKETDIQYVLNCPCTVADKSKYQSILHQALKERINIITIAINARKIVLYNNMQEFRLIFDQNKILPVPDGIGATIPMRLFNKKKSEKIDFPGFMFEFCDKNSIKCFFLGATESHNEKAVSEVRRIYPGIVVAGRHSGFNINEESLLANWIKNGTQVVFIAMGSPKQELLSARLARNSSGIIFVGVGGRFDILANEVKRAPKFLIAMGLEWTYRFFTEPKRIKQQKNDLILYLIFFLKRLFFRSINPKY